MTSELLKLHTLFTTSLNEIFIDFDKSEADDILDNRDLTTFSDLWTNAFEQTKQSIINIEHKNKIDEIRKEVFMMTFSKTNSSDLSAYISEDFELISSHLLTSDTNRG